MTPTATDDERAVVEAHLRRLDPGACAALVADLWAERGYDAVREGTVVTATRSGETLAIRVGGRRGDAAEADVLVSLDGSGTAPEGVRVLDAADLTERLWYAVDRSVARELCERHLGAPPADLRPPLGMRVRHHLSSGPSPAVAALALVAVVAVVGAVAVGMPGGSDVAAPPGSGAPAADDVTRTPWEARLPPGITSEGIEDLDVLAAAHRRAAADRPLTIWVDREEPTYDDGWRLTTLDFDLRSNGEEYTVAVSEGPRDNRTRLGTLYHDGTNSYVKVANRGEPSYRQLSPSEQERGTVPTPPRLSLELVTKYLSTPTTEMTGTVERDGRTLYRLVGTGQPASRSLDGVENYTVTAEVGTDGLVYNLRASYDIVENERRYRKTDEVTYARLDATTVTAPAWYERRFAGEPTPTG
ncbi:hypothetical protein [Salinibaculum marinum]